MERNIEEKKPLSTYRVGEDLYQIDDTQVDEFGKQFPDAKKVYTVGNQLVNIPIANATKWREEHPYAEDYGGLDVPKETGEDISLQTIRDLRQQLYDSDDGFINTYRSAEEKVNQWNDTNLKSRVALIEPGGTQGMISDFPKTKEDEEAFKIFDNETNRRRYAQYKDMDKPLAQAQYSHPEWLAERKANVASLEDSLSSIEDKSGWTFRQARRLLRDAIDVYQSPGKYDESNGFVNFMKGAGNRIGSLEYWDAGISEIARNFGLRDVMKKLEAHESEGENLDVNKVLSEGEKALLGAYFASVDAQNARAEDLSLGFQAGQGAADSFQYAAEFLLTDGLYSGVKNLTKAGIKAGTKGVAKALTKWATTSGKKKFVNVVRDLGRAGAERAGQAAGTIARTAVMGSTYRNISEEGLKTDENGHVVSAGEAWTKGITNSLIENYSEVTGDFLGKAGSELLGNIVKVVPGQTPGALVRFIDRAGKSKVNKILNRAGFNGFLGEMFEEVYGSGLQSLLGAATDDKLGQESALKDFFDKENIYVTAASFLPMTMIGVGGNIARMSKAKDGRDSSFDSIRDILERNGSSPEEIDILRNSMENGTVADAARAMYGLMRTVANEGSIEDAADLYRNAWAYLTNNSVVKMNEETFANDMQGGKDLLDAYIQGDYMTIDDASTLKQAEEVAGAVLSDEDKALDPGDLLEIARYQTEPVANVLTAYAQAKARRQGFIDNYQRAAREDISLQNEMVEQRRHTDGMAHQVRLKGQEEGTSPIFIIGGDINSYAPSSPDNGPATILMGITEAGEKVPVNASDIMEHTEVDINAWKQTIESETRKKYDDQLAYYESRVPDQKMSEDIFSMHGQSEPVFFNNGGAIEKVHVVSSMDPDGNVTIERDSPEQGQQKIFQMPARQFYESLVPGQIIQQPEAPAQQEEAPAEEAAPQQPEAQEGQQNIDEQDEAMQEAIAARMEHLEDKDEDLTVEGQNGHTYRQHYLIDGKEEITKVDAPDENGNYNGSRYEVDGKSFGDMPELLAYMDSPERKRMQDEQYAVNKFVDDLVSDYDGKLQGADRDADATISSIQGKIDKLSKELSKGIDRTDEKQIEKRRKEREQKKALEDTLNQWKGYKTVIQKRIKDSNASLLAEQNAKLEAEREERRRKIAEKQEAQKATQDIRPKEKYQSAKKGYGREASITLPNGQVLKGRYVVAPSESVTPSHNPFDSYNPSEGYPTDNGKGINERDYKSDMDAQIVTEEMSRQYDGRAVNEPPIVDEDGIVLSGNGRVQAGSIAAQNGTDVKYSQSFLENAQSFGVTPEDIQGVPHARVFFELSEKLPYTAETTALFNAQNQKMRSATENAVAHSKKLGEEGVRRITDVMEEYSSLDSFFDSEKGAADIISILQPLGIVNSMEIAGYVERETGKLSQVGRDYVTNLMLGTLFEEDTIRKLGADRGLKASVLRAVKPLSANAKLADYSLKDEIGKALSIIFDANNAKMSLPLYARQGNLFDGSMSDRYSEAEIQLAFALKEGGIEQFREWVTNYNKLAESAASGEIDLMSQNVPTREELINEVVEYYAKRIDTTAAADEGASSGTQLQAGTQEEKESSGGNGNADDVAEGQQQEVIPSQDDGFNSIFEEADKAAKKAEIRAEAGKVDTSPSEGQKKAGNYKKGHITLDGYGVTIEQPKGSMRSGTDADGKQWSTEMHNNYGYIRGTKGKDGDQIDIFLSDNPSEGEVYVIDQVNPKTGEFDEHKVMYGFQDADSAKEAYLSNYEEGWKGLGTITPVSKDEFKKWIDSSTRKGKPFSEYSSVKTDGDIIVENGISPEITSSKNALVTEERMAELRKRMKEKLANMNFGLDPEMLSIGTEMTVYYIENGVRKFAAFAKTMIDDLGEKIRPYLKAFYNGARDLPGMEELSKEMDSYEEVSAFDIANFGKEIPSIIETAEEVAHEQEIQDKAEKIRLDNGKKIGSVQQSKDTRDNSDIWVVKPTDRVSKEDFSSLKRKAKNNGGYWSSFKKGFLFKSEEEANNFNNIDNGTEAQQPEETTDEQTAANSVAVVSEAETVAGEAEALADAAAEQPADHHGYKLGDKIRFLDVFDTTKTHEGTVYDFDPMGNPVIDTGHAPVLYECVGWDYVLSRHEVEEPEKKETSLVTPKQLKEQEGKIDEQLKKVDEQLALLGYYKDADTEYNELNMSKTAERALKADLSRLGKQICADLGLEPVRNKKGKDESAYTNIAPAGGEGHLSLQIPNTDKKLVLWVYVDWIDDGGKSQSLTTEKSSHIVYRVDGLGSDYGNNNWASADIAYGELLGGIKRIGEIRVHLKATGRLEEPKTAPKKADSDLVSESNIFELPITITKEEKKEARNLDNPKVSSNLGAKKDADQPSLFDNTNTDDNGQERETNTGSQEVVPRESDSGDMGTDAAGADGRIRTGRTGQPSSDGNAESGTETDGGRVRGNGGNAEEVRPSSVGRERNPEERTSREISVQDGTSVQHTGTAGQSDGRTAADGTGKELSEGESSGVADGRSVAKKKPQPQKRYINNYLYPEDASAIDNMSQGERLSANVQALEVLRTLLKEGRKATEEERQILGRFRGWGGVNLGRSYSTDMMRYESNSDIRKLADIIDEFDPDKNKGILEAINRAALSSYYTPTPIARAINHFLELAGYKGGKMLDPSMGNGIFEGTMPKDIQQRTEIRGIELDWMTGQIAKHLYPDADVRINGFEASGIAQNSYDVVESNIPFGNISVNDKEWKGEATAVRKAAQGRIHNYFAVKMLESTRPGGLCVIMTSNAILDTKGNQIIRDYIADQAEVLGVVRLPDNTFKGAGTSVVTDVIFLRKYRDEADRTTTRTNQSYIDSIESPFLHTTETELTNRSDGKTYKVAHNSYFAVNPKMLLGEQVAGGQYSSDQYGLTSTFSSDELGKKMDELVSKEIVGKRKGKLFDTSTSTREAFHAVRESYTGDGDFVSNGNIVEQNGKYGVLVAERGKYGTVTRNFEELPLKGKGPRISAMIPLRKAMKQLISEEISGADNNTLSSLRSALQKLYDGYVKKFGRLQDKDNDYLEGDIDGYSLRSLEKWKEGKFVGLSDIFTKNTIKPALDLSQAKTPADAVSISLSEYGEIRPSFMEKILGAKWKEQCGTAIFPVPFAEDRYETRDAYLSGDVKTKLNDARKAAETDKSFEANVKALEEVQPKDIPFSDITVRMGARWVPAEMYSAFLKEIFGIYGNWKGTKSGVQYSPAADMFTVNIDSGELGGLADAWRTERRSASEVFEAALKDKSLTVWDTFKDSEGHEQKVVNKEQTELVNGKVQDLRTEFEDWLPRDSERVQKLQDIYNDLFNRSVLRKFDGSHLNVPGLMGKELRQHQKDAVWMLINNRGGIVDHIVGAGKTLVMQSAIMEMRRMGIAKKPMIVALKSTVAQITKEFREAYPAARVLAPSNKDFQKENRKKFLANISLNDYDCVIISHEQYCMLPHSEEMESQVINEQLAQLDNAIEFLYGQGDKSNLTKKQIKGLEKRKANLEAKLDKLIDRKVDREFTFENMGVDYLFVDECQAFKSLPYVTSYQNIAGLGDSEGSQKAVALLNGIRYLQKMHQGDMGTVFLSGTTITNSLVEIYNLLQYLRPREMERLGLTTFDAWASQFAVRSSELEYGVTNELKEKNRFRYFDNVAELSKMYAEIADVRNDMNLQLPKPKPNMHIVTVPASESLQEINAQVVEMVKSKNGSYFGLTTNDRSPFGLLASTISEKAAISTRLIDPDLDDSEGKVKFVCENVKKIYDKFAGQKGTQLIFCDTGVPVKGKPYDAYSDIIGRLVNEYGIPREEIVDIHEADNDVKRKALFAKVNEGKVRILIGGTKNMGTGVNVQKRIVAMHHMDVPWTPADREQREGRGVRQGNEIARDFNGNTVDIYFYATEGSLDMYKYQLQDTKGKMFAQFKSSTVGERNFDEGSGDEQGGFDPAEIVAILSGNPVIFEKSKQDKLVDKLRRAKRAYESDWQRRKSKYDELVNSKYNYERLVGSNDRDNAALTRGGFVADEKGVYPSTVTVQVSKGYTVESRKTFDKPKEAGEYIHKLLKEGKRVSLSGFGMTARITTSDTENLFGKYAVELDAPSGIKYSTMLSEDDTAAGLALRTVLTKVISNKEVYKRNLEETKHLIEGSDPKENSFPKQSELEAAIEKQRQLDAEYKKLSDDKEPEEATPESEHESEEEDDTRYRDNDIDAVNSHFNEELDILTPDNADSIVLKLGMPSDVLISAGIPNKEMKLYGNKLLKKAKLHGFDVKDVKGLPLAIREPIAVFLGSHQDSYAVLTELTLNGQNALVSIETDKKGEVEFNLISSVFGKENKGVINWINTSKLLYTDKKRTLEFVSPSALNADATQNQEFDSAAKIIQDFDNPKITDENRYRERTSSAPKHTKKAYKLFKVDEEGRPHALFIDSAIPLEAGKWYDADSPRLDDMIDLEDGFYLMDRDGNAKKVEKPSAKEVKALAAKEDGSRYMEVDRYSDGSKRFSNLGINGSGTVTNYGLRPGWHITNAPSARHIGAFENKKPSYRRSDERWFEVEYATDVDYNKEADESTSKAKGIDSHIPENGFYEFKTNTNANPNQKWIISGAMKIVRPLSEAEAQDINDEQGIERDLPYKDGKKDFSEEADSDTTQSPMLSAIRMEKQAVELGEKLNVKINVVSREQMPEGHKDAKGYYSKGAIYLCPENHTSSSDVVATVLHEAVAHYGLRKLLGKQFNSFLDSVFESVDADTREHIAILASHNGWDLREATEEYLAELAEKTDFTSADRSNWQKIKDFFNGLLEKILGRKVNLTDNDLRYILIRSYDNLTDPDGTGTGIFDAARDAALRDRFPDEGRRFRSAPTNIVGNIARDIYEKDMKRKAVRLRESYQDSMLALKKLTDAVIAESGVEMRDYEDAYMAENHKSSKNTAQKGYYMRNYWKPMMDFVMEYTKGDEGKYADVQTYVKAKHGLERNEIFAKRDADQWRKLREEQATAKLEKEKANADKWFLDGTITQAQYDKVITDAEDDFNLSMDYITNKYPKKLAEFRSKDYSGLSSIFKEDSDADNTPISEYERRAQEYVDKFEASGMDTEELWRKINSCTKKTLLHSVDSGLLTQAGYEKIRDMFQNYVPLRGFNETTSEDIYEYLTHSESPFSGMKVTAKGRKSDADDPFASIANMAESEIQQGNNNLMKQRFLYFVMNRPTSLVSVKEAWYQNMGSEDNPDWVRVLPDIDVDATPEETMNAYEAWEQNMETLRKEGRARKGKLPDVPFRIVNTKDKKEHFIYVQHQGKEYCIVVNGNPRAAQALNGLTNPEANGKILQAIRQVNRWISANYTTRSPQFILRNAVRDSIFSLFAIDIKEDRPYYNKFRRNLFKNYGRMYKLVSMYNSGTLDMSNDTHRYLQEFFDNGGETGYSMLRSVDEYKRDIKRMQQELRGGTATTAAKAGRAMLDGLDFVNRCVENMCRFSAFMTSREMGRSIDQSVASAKEISVNFNKKGSGVTPLANIFKTAYFFFNAGVQALNNFMHLAQANPKKFSRDTLKVLTLGAMVPVLNSLISSMVGGDDDEYWDLPTWIRRNNLVIGGGDFYVTLPLPIELRAIYGIGDIVTSLLSDKYTGKNVFSDVLSQLAEFMPVDFIGTKDSSWYSNFIPDILSPIFENIINKDFTGKPLYKDNQFNKDMPSFTKAYAGTNRALVRTSELVNRIGGGDEYRKGFIEREWSEGLNNPAKWENIFEGYLGGMINFANDVMNTFAPIWDEEARTASSMAKIFPMLSVLVSLNDERTKSSFVEESYYQYLDEARETKRLLRDYKADPKYREKYDKLRSSDDYRIYNYFEMYNKKVEDYGDKAKEAKTPQQRDYWKQRQNDKKRELVEKLRSMD